MEKDIMLSRVIYVLTILFWSTLLAQEPSWVKQRPASPQYFIGIGSSDKTSSGYRNLAKADALNDLASEISVSVSSELIDVMTEYSGFSEEYARSDLIRLNILYTKKGHHFKGHNPRIRLYIKPKAYFIY